MTTTTTPKPLSQAEIKARRELRVTAFASTWGDDVDDRISKAEKIAAFLIGDDK